MKVSKSDVVSVFKAIGMQKPEKLSDKDLKDRANKLHQVKQIKETLPKLKDKAAKNLLQAMIDALKGGKKVEITDDPKAGKKKVTAPADEEEEDEAEEEEAEEVEEEEESEEADDEAEESEDDEEGEEDETADADDEGDEGDDEEEEESEEEDEEVTSKKSTKKGDKAGKKDKKPATKKAKTTVERNEFGHKVGTRAAKIDAAITDKPKTIAQIAKDAKYTTAPFHGHMKQLVDRGFVLRKEKDGEVVYFRKGKGGSKK